MKTYIAIAFAALLILTGCRDEGSTIAEEAAPTPANTAAEIDMEGHTAECFLYNSMENSLSMITKDKHNYSLFVWHGEGGWSAPVTSWKCKKKEALENFVYSTDGTLYACKKQYENKKLIGQTFVKLRKNGTQQTISLKNMNQVGSENYNITDIKFDGTALALTYACGTVKFYNIEEGQALGAASIRGTAGRNMLYDFHYLTETIDQDSQRPSLKDYDIRTGEVTKTFPLGEPGQTDMDIQLTNYRDKLYLLSPNGLFSGSCTNSILYKLADRDSLPLPEENRILYFQAARDDMLYLAFLDGSSRVHLYHFTLPANLNSPSPMALC